MSRPELPDPADLAAVLLLDGLTGFGPGKFAALHDAGLTPRALLDDPERAPFPGRSGEKLRHALQAIRNEDRQKARARAERQLERAADHTAHVLLPVSAGYPPILLGRRRPAPWLYVRGDPSLLDGPLAVALVGSRAVRQPYAAAHAAAARVVAELGGTVVSGFAAGADRIGHEAALDAGGATVLVMPCGLDLPFPPEQRDLWHRMLDDPRAVLVSELHFGTRASTLTLRKRNVLIAALSRAVLVSQCGDRSGTMNTVRAAIEQHIPVGTFVPDEGEDTSGNTAVAALPERASRIRPDVTVLPCGDEAAVRAWCTKAAQQDSGVAAATPLGSQRHATTRTHAERPSKQPPSRLACGSGDGSTPSSNSG